MKKNLRRLAAVLAVSLLLLPASVWTGAAETDARDLTADVQYGAQNYINNIRTRSVAVSGNRLAAVDEGTVRNQNWEDGAIYFYGLNSDGTRAGLERIYRYDDGTEEGYFNPRAVAFLDENSIYCLNRITLLRITFDANGEQTEVSVVDSFVYDFQYVGGVLYTMTLAADKSYQINRMDETDEGWTKNKLYGFTNPPVKDFESFATDGETFFYYDKDTGLYTADANGQTNDPDFPTPTKLAVLDGRLLALTDGTLLGEPCTTFEICERRIYLVNQNRIERFRLEGDKLVSDHFVLAKESGVSRPEAMTAGPNGDLILDGKQNAVVTRNGSIRIPGSVKNPDYSDIAKPDTPESKEKIDFTGASRIAAFGDSFFAANSTHLAEFNLTGRESDDTPTEKNVWSGAIDGTKSIRFENIRALCTSVSGEIYLSSGGQIFKKAKDEPVFRPLRTIDAEYLAVSTRNNRLYALSDGTITILGKTSEEDETIPVSLPGATAFALDFQNQIFTLCTDGTLKRISRAEFGSKTSDSESDYLTETFRIERKSLLDSYGTSFTDLFLNNETGTISLLDPELSLVFSLDKSETGVVLFSTVPELEVTVNPLDKTPGAFFKLAKINGYPSTLLYPAADGVTVPEGTVKELETLASGTQVYVLEETDDTFGGSYAFVCIAKNKSSDPLKFGFVLNTNLEIFGTASPEFEEGYTGFSTELWKYPETDSAFLCETLPKDLLVTLEDVPAEGWVKVSFERNGTKTEGFVRRSALVRKVTITLDERKNASTVGVANVTPLYRNPSIASEVIRELPDKTKVKLIERTGGFYFVETADGETGYIEMRFTVEEGFSNRQMIGIILLCSVAVVAALTLLIRKKIIH